MTEKIVDLEKISLLEFFGVNEKNLSFLSILFPLVQLVLRGNSLKIIGKEKDIEEIIKEARPDIFISGHSHILKVIYDKKYNLLHINPGAAGKYGFHQVSTLVRFEIKDKRAENLEIMEIKK